MTSNKEHFIYKLVQEYNQLALPVKDGMSNENIYKDTVMRGRKIGTFKLDFKLDSKDTYEVIEMNYVSIKYMCIYNRIDFIKIVQKLAYKCEPVNIPDTMGSIIIKGIINWDKIRTHKYNYEAIGGEQWKDEFKRFTSIKSNYQDYIIVVTSGGYSNLTCEQAHFSEADWDEISINIRKYHELTHFIYLNQYCKLRNAVFDEVIADCIGISFTLGYYDKHLACECLGISKGSYILGHRLENYIAIDKINENICIKINRLIDILAKIVNDKLKYNFGNKNYSSILLLDEILSYIYNNKEIMHLHKALQDVYI